MQKKHYEISPSGQLIEVLINKSLITNPDQILSVLKDEVNAPATPEDVANTAGDLKSFYNLGDGVCVFQREFGSTLKTFGGIMLQHIPFYTQWALHEQNDVHVLIPNDGQEDPVELGAPLVMPVPADLIIHFFVEWHHSSNINIVQPNARLLWQLPDLLRQNVADCYLTAFSRSRNTCVRLPLPNLYGDAHLCTGNSFSHVSFQQKPNHWGIGKSIKTFAKCWSESGFNLDLLGTRGGRLMNQYRRFIRFNADTGEFMPFSGCADWTLGTSNVPLEDVYKPWLSNEQPSMPVYVEGEENLTEDDGEIPRAAPRRAQPTAAPTMPEMAMGTAENQEEGE